MRKRNVQVIFRLNQSEHQNFCKRVKKSRLSQESYLRHLINGLMPNDAPPPDYYTMMNQLYKVGNNLNQISAKAHALGFIDTQKYDSAVEDFKKTVRTITKEVILPKPMY